MQLITIRFIEKCLWQLSSGVIKTYFENETIVIDEKTALEMVKHGYAILVEDVLDNQVEKMEFSEDAPKRGRKPKQSPENKMLDEVSDENK